MERPLEGIKVVDCTLAGAGPSCTKLLTEYGAETIWVEPLRGTSTRSIFKFDFYTTGKRSIVLDLKTQDGKKILHRFLQEADVFVSNYRTCALKRLGLTYEELSGLYPRLIYATITGFGEEGPAANDPGYDPVAFWSRGGMLSDFAEKGSLLVPPVAVGDIVAGQALAGGICAALYQRERTQKGTRIFTSLLAQAAYLNHDAIVESQYGEKYPKSRLAPRRALLNSYPCADGKWITITLTDHFDRCFWALLKAVGREDLVGDSRWSCFRDTMYERAPEVVAILDEAFSKMTQEEAVDALSAIDVPVSKVQSTVDMMQDPQVLENRFLFDIVASDGKNLKIPANPVKFRDKNSGVENFKRGPRLGEHSVEILREYRYSEEEIRMFFETGVAFTE